MATMFDRLFGFDSQEEDKSIGDMLREYTSAVHEELKGAGDKIEAVKNMPEQMWDAMHPLDKAALVSSVTPLVNTTPVPAILGVAADTRSAIQEPEEFFTKENLALTGLSYLPYGRLKKYGDQLGIFGGYSAKNAPQDKYVDAENLAWEGKSPERIFEETGIVRGADKNMMHVIDDSASKFKLVKDGKLDYGTYKLGDLLDHPELYKAYPELQDMKINLSPNHDAYGTYYPQSNSITMRHGATNTKTGEYAEIPPEEMRGYLIHELNHAVQEMENLARGGNLESGARLGQIVDDAARYGQSEMDKITKQVDDIYANPDRKQATKLLAEAKTLDEIDRLKGYLQDYYRGGNLTDKRRHILNSGAYLMDVNKESRMRHNTLTAKRHRPKAERNAQFASYIESVIADAESRLDPKLVETVRGSGVKNPAKKYERQVDKLSKDIKPLMDQKWELEKQVNTANKYGKNTVPEFAIMERDDGSFFVTGMLDQKTGAPKVFPDRYSAEQAAIAQFSAHPNYNALAGEAFSRMAEEMLDKGIKNPFLTKEMRMTPLDQMIYWSPNPHGKGTKIDYAPFNDLLEKSMAAGYKPNQPTPKILESAAADYRGFDDYLSKVNPKGTEVPAEARPNLMMGDMYGMLPKGSKAIKSEDGVTFYKGADGNYYATAYNPDVGEQDVVGYISGRGDMTELAVVEEMQGKGIGSELQYLFRKDNPYAPTGGLTESGKKLLEKTFKRLEAEGVLPK